MSSVASRRIRTRHPRLTDWRADVDPLACLLGFSATGLLVGYLLVLMQASAPSTVLLNAVLVGATAPFAALVGLAVDRQP